MIHVRDLQFTYGKNSFRLRVEDLSIETSERVAMIGPSGTGKTTLLHLVAGILSPSEGRIECDETELTGLVDAERRNFRVANIGLIFQDFALLDHLTVLDNILLPYRINRTLQLSESVLERASQLATDVGLGAMLKRHPKQLSHGERQRIAVCRALIANPKVILADEPTANLDEDNAARVFNALDQHVERHGATVFVVTHDLDMARRFDRTIDVSSFCQPPEETVAGGSDNER